MTISLPPEMAKDVERVRKAERRTRSELIREALRAYLAARIPTVQPSAAELRGIRQGRQEIRRGNYVTVDQLAYGLGRSRRAKSRKSA